MQPNKARWIVLLLAALPLCIAAGTTPQREQQARGESKSKVVRVVVDYGDGVEKHFTRIPWKEGQTVLDAMKAAKAWPHGIEFRYTGRGATAFLTQIDDVKNAGADGRNWLFRVNGKLAMKSFGVQEVQGGDRVTWSFQEFRFGE